MYQNCKFIITCDLDWAPDWMIEFACDILSDYKTTFFLTNDSPLQKKLAMDIDHAGYHPNLLPNSDHGSNIVEAFEYFDSFTPKLFMNRFHLFGHSERDLKFISNRGITLDSSLIFLNSEAIDLVWRPDLSLNILPNFWMDGTWYFSKNEKLKLNKGLKSIIVHPIDLYFNFSDNESRELLKKSVKSVNDLTIENSSKFINHDNFGSRDKFKEILSNVEKKDIIPLSSIIS